MARGEERDSRAIAANKQLDLDDATKAIKALLGRHHRDRPIVHGATERGELSCTT